MWGVNFFTVWENAFVSFYLMHYAWFNVCSKVCAIMDMESKDNREKTSQNGLEVAIKHKCLSLFIFNAYSWD